MNSTIAVTTSLSRGDTSSMVRSYSLRSMVRSHSLLLILHCAVGISPKHPNGPTKHLR